MNGDPKKNRIEAYARLREQSLITFDDEQMEQLMSEEENRASFHSFLLEKDATDFPDFNQWESKFFSDKKKVPSSPDAGEPSLDGSSGTSKPIEEAPESVDIRTVLESQGVMFKPQGGQPPTMPVDGPTVAQDETLSQDEPLSLIETIVEPAPLQAAPMDVPLYSSMLETRKARKDATITKIKQSPPEALENPVTGYDVLVADDDNKKLHGDPNTSDWTKGLLKARTFEDAADAVTERMGFIEAAIPGDVMDRYSTVKAALIEISETGQLEGNQAAQQLFAEYSQILEENPGLAEYDELNAKAYSISQGYQNIRNTNPTYFTDIDRRKLMQDYSDFKDKQKPKFIASVQAMGRAAGTELTNTLQGMLGTIAAFGNITGGRATTFDWADRLAEWSTRYLDPGLAGPGPGGIAYGQPSKYQRSLFTNTARISGFQVDIDSKGNATAVRDNNGYIVGDENIRNDIIAEYEAAPEKYDVRYRPHLAPTLTTAAGGVMQVLITSRFAGLGRTAAAAKAIAAGQLTSRFAGQTYLQSLEEFGPENADIASRFAITTATLQSAVSLYINPLELRLSPKSFAVTNTTLRKIASDLNRGLSKDAALRNGVRYYAADLARYMKAYGADVGKESLEGAFEKAIDIAGRRIVRSATDINAEYDASLSSFIESMVSEGAGALFAAGGAIAQSNQWQQEQLMVAYENRDRILPMIKARYGEELVGKMQEVFDAADKRIVGVKTSREQKNQILLEEYHKITKPSANEGTAAMPPSEPVVPSQSEQAIPQAPAEEVAVAAKPSIYDIVRDEAREMRLEEGDTFVADGGIAYEVVSREENDVTIRSEDTGREYTFPISEVRADLTNKYQDIIAREHPTTDPVRLAGLRRAASRTISDENVTSPRQSVTPVNMTEAQQPAVPATEPTTPTESIAQAPIEPGVAKVGTQAPVFTMENIEQAEGVDGAAIKTLLQSISQIAPGIKVRIHESVEELSAEAGFKASAYIIGDHTIVISKESTLLDITHEVVHPIMAATELKTPGVTERFFDEIMTKLPGDIAGEMEGFRSKYGEESEETQRDEVVTEFLARIASGRYDESILGNESIVDSMLRFFQSIFAKLGLTNPPTDVDSLRTFVKRIVPALQKGEVIELAGEAEGKAEGETKARRSPVIEDEIMGKTKARLTSSNMDVRYYRAKAWMKEEWGAPRATMEADAVAMFGITPAQAGIMYEVLSKSPDIKTFSRPPGIEVRKGIWGILDKAGQLRNEYLLSSKGMPREVQIAMEMANGEEAVLAQTTVKGYNRIKKLLSKYDKADRVKIKEIADRFIIGEATEAEILFLDKQLYYELLTIRSNLDEVTSAIMDEGSFSALRDEILAGNLGEYVNRAFRIHLSKNYTPDQAAIVAFRKEYKRLNGERITDELILEHMTKGIPPPTVDDIERIIQNNADNAMETMLEENRPGKGGKAQASAGKPTGIMKERKAFAGAGGKLADWINDNPAGSVPPADMVDAARQSFIGDRTREAIHKHPEHKAEINRAIKEGDKLIKLATRLGVAVPTGNPFSAEGIRNAVTSGNPITWTVPATVPPADAIKMQAHINKINDSIATVVDAIQDRAEDDLVTVLLGKNRIDGTDGWRAQEHLLPGTRAILGEIPPLEAAVITMSKLANYYTVEKYYKLLKALGEGVFIFNANDIHIPVWATATIGAAGSERTSPLDGMKTAPEIAHILTQTEKFTGGVDLTVNWFQKINGFIQYNLTILSPRTQSRNFLSNIWFVVRNWWSDPVRATLALGVVPMDLIAMKASQGRIRLTPKHDALRDMSDSLAAALYQNFGKGFSQYNKITPADAGFGTTPDQVALFQKALRWMQPKMSDKSLNKADIIADAQATLGITSEQAHSLYSNLQPIGYNDYMGELVNKLAGAGLIGSSVSLRIIYDNIRQLNSPDKVAAFLTNSMLNDATNVADRAILLARKGLKLFESAYGMSDDTFKIFGYLQERAKYASALFGKKYFELSDEQKVEADNKAIEVTKNIIPNYNRLGVLAKSISKNIFIGNFIAFKIESMRTWYNHLALAQKEITDGINSGNGRMVQMGGARMAGLLAATATQLGIEAVVYGMAAKAVPAGFKWIGGAVGSLLKAATGGGSDDEDEERTEMMRLLSPSFSAYDYLVMTKEPEEGKFTTVSISANHPLGDFQRASNYALLGIQKHDPWSQVAFFTALQMMGNLADTKILVQIAFETESGEDSYGGRIWDETDSTDEKIKKSVQYAIKKAGPGITGQLSRLGWMDWVPSNEAFGWLHKPAHAGTAAEEAFGMATGFRPIVVDAYRVFQESIDSYVPGFGESGLQSSIFNDAQPNNENISNAVFEEQIKGMVEKEWRFLRNLHRMYYLTTKYDITEADKMQQIMADQGLSYDPSNVTGRPFQIIATGKYSLPWNQIRKVEGRRMQNEKLKEPYQGISRELEAWLMEYERENQ